MASKQASRDSRRLGGWPRRGEGRHHPHAMALPFLAPWAGVPGAAADLHSPLGASLGALSFADFAEAHFLATEPTARGGGRQADCGRGIPSLTCLF